MTRIGGGFAMFEAAADGVTGCERTPLVVGGVNLLLLFNARDIIGDTNEGVVNGVPPVLDDSQLDGGRRSTNFCHNLINTRHLFDNCE